MAIQAFATNTVDIELTYCPTILFGTHDDQHADQLLDLLTSDED